MWWDDDTINATVTRSFVCSHLIPTEIERLDKPLSFGDGLTNTTYYEWIEQKAKRIFLILVDIGKPDQIFGILDDSWDDEDLPIAMDQVERLSLTLEKDEKNERRFFDRQFYYTLKKLQPGGHMVYQDNEVVPLDVVDKKLVPGQSSAIDKVTLPGHPDMVLCRRRLPLGPGSLSLEDFLFEIECIKKVQNEHLVSYFCSYSQHGYGYVLFTPATDLSLKSFLTTTPNYFKNLEKKRRRELVMNWIHCLIDTISYLHSRGLSHGNVKPSTVLFANDDHIALSDFTCFSTELLGSAADKSSFDKESYDYAAPEQWFKPTSSGSHGAPHRRTTVPPSSSRGAGSTMSSLSSGFASSPEAGNYTITRTASDLGHSPVAMMHTPTPLLDPQAADIFSLGCVILELLSFLLKKHGKPFAAHRGAKHKTPGRGGAVLDSSFHKNLGQVDSWMTLLAKEASKKDDPVFKGVAPMLQVVERMLSPHPLDRPAATDIQTSMYQIITGHCGISEPHCVHQYGGWDFGVGKLKLSPAGLTAIHDNGSVVSRRSAGSRNGHHHHRRQISSSGSSSTRSIPRSASLVHHDLLDNGERSGGSNTGANELGGSGGFQALQNIRLIKDRLKPWQAPSVCAEMGVS